MINREPQQLWPGNGVNTDIYIDLQFDNLNLCSGMVIALTSLSR